MFTIKRSRNMNPSYSIIRSLCFFFNQVVLSSEKICISPCVIRQKAMQCFVLSDRRLCNVFLLLSDKRLCDVFLLSDKKLCNGILLSDKRLYNVVVWVGRQKAMKCCFFSPASNICIYI